MRNSTIRINSKKLFYLIGVFAILMFWTLISIIQKNQDVFPNILSVIKSLIRILQEKNTYIKLLMTIIRIIIALISGYLISFLIILLYNINANSIYLFKPIIALMKSVPVIILTLFILLTVGSNIGIYIVNILIIVPIIIEGLINGLDNINPEINDYMTLEKASKTKKLIFIKLPIIKNYIFMTLFQTIGLSFKSMIMSEYLFSFRNSIGNDLSDFQAFVEINNLLAWAIIILVIVSIVETFLEKIKLTIK